MPRLLLAIMIAGFTGTLLEVFLHTTGLTATFPDVAFSGTIMAMLQPGAIYLYTKSVMYRDFKPKARHLLHLLPLLAASLVFLVGYYSLPTETQARMLSDSHYPGVMNSIAVALALHGIMLGYLGATLRMISRFGLELRNIFSDLGNKELSWLRILLLAYTAAWSLSLVYCVLAHVMRVTGSHEGLTIATTVVSILVLLPMSVLAFRQPEAFSGIPSPALSEVKPVSLETDGPPVEELAARIEQLMEQQRPYLHSNLTVSRLAHQAELTPRDLSRFLNQKMGMNFYEFVNGYRIEHARVRLANPSDNASITDILYESGFNSKSVFNTLFRKTTGKTPSEYRRLNPNRSSAFDGKSERSDS
ncbi:helix-turn-helix domain-containing protein [Marinobacter sp. F4206]|uniref:helix-turn-helix domain-containing protein n=1 Tax=Marinobacter sp. F4206 TaxID=2861777 RepID=UPI001C5FEC82|nr:helix-turn-helix transcriptional regulator [Marinobacter sp. F4206]MBW4934269.1 helix-turn-helix transcriptional regulator [Marinobacter sp. F4206]